MVKKNFPSCRLHSSHNCSNNSVGVYLDVHGCVPLVQFLKSPYLISEKQGRIQPWIWLVPKLKMATGHRRCSALAAGGLGAAQGPQKPKGFRCSEMHSQSFLALQIINFIVLLFKKFHLISGTIYRQLNVYIFKMYTFNRRYIILRCRQPWWSQVSLTCCEILQWPFFSNYHLNEISLNSRLDLTWKA